MYILWSHSSATSLASYYVVNKYCLAMKVAISVTLLLNVSIKILRHLFIHSYGQCTIYHHCNRDCVFLQYYSIFVLSSFIIFLKRRLILIQLRIFINWCSWRFFFIWSRTRDIEASPLIYHKSQSDDWPFKRNWIDEVTRIPGAGYRHGKRVKRKLKMESVVGGDDVSHLATVGRS